MGRNHGLLFTFPLHFSIHNRNGSPTCSERTAEGDLHNRQHVRGPRWARSLPLLWSVMWLNNDAFALRQCPNVLSKGGKSFTANLAFRTKLKAAPICFKNFKIFMQDFISSDTCCCDFLWDRVWDRKSGTPKEIMLTSSLGLSEPEVLPHGSCDQCYSHWTRIGDFVMTKKCI